MTSLLPPPSLSSPPAASSGPPSASMAPLTEAHSRMRCTMVTRIAVSHPTGGALRSAVWSCKKASKPHRRKRSALAAVGAHAAETS